MNNYSAYLKTEHWKEFRELALEKLGRICADCGTTEVEFDVHHLTYKTLWHEKLSDVIVLCKSCHMERHLEKIIMRKFKTDCLTVEEILHVGLKRHEKKWGKVKLGDSFAVITKSGDVIIARVNSKGPA